MSMYKKCNICNRLPCACEEDSEGEFFIGTEEIREFVKCSHCKCTGGIHLVTCIEFHCKKCGKYGSSPEHYGGCPECLTGTAIPAPRVNRLRGIESMSAGERESAAVDFRKCQNCDPLKDRVAELTEALKSVNAEISATCKLERSQWDTWQVNEYEGSRRLRTRYESGNRIKAAGVLEFMSMQAGSLIGKGRRMNWPECDKCGSSTCCGGCREPGTASPAEKQDQRLVEIDQEITMLRGMVILLQSEPGDETAPIYQRTINRLQKMLTQLRSVSSEVITYSEGLDGCYRINDPHDVG